ncbi:MAG: hypothetical protein Q9P01_18685 [Anaerolineae bacterium]|nr:hypothetical protein [Anaerolineae bacterium]
MPFVSLLATETTFSMARFSLFRLYGIITLSFLLAACSGQQAPVRVTIPPLRLGQVRLFIQQQQRLLLAIRQHKQRPIQPPQQ